MIPDSDRARFKKLFNAYTDDYNFIRLNPNHKDENHSDNVRLFTSTAMLLDLVRGTKIFDFERYVDTVNQCRVLPGLFGRYPTNKEDKLEQHDNDIGMLVALWYGAKQKSSVRAQSIISKIYFYGEQHGYYYHNIKQPGYRPSAQRKPHVIAFIKYCAGLKPSLWDRIFLTGGIVLSLLQNRFKTENGKSHTSSTILSWHILMVLRNRSDYWAMFDDIFNRAFDIKKAFQIYYGSDHPIVKLAYL